jgi:hypothetical protein
MHLTSTPAHRMHDPRGRDCDDHDAACCMPAEFTRLRYAYGLRLGALELSDEQSYLVGKHRFHNLRCHGRGVLCGLRVDRFVWPQGAAEHTRSTMLRVWRGAALDGCGREVLVPCDQCIDVAAWFAEIRHTLKLDERPPRFRIWVGLRYRECPSDPAPVPRDPCGCDTGGCAYTRVHESFELRLFAGEPPHHHGDVFPSAHSLLAALSREGMPAAERRGEELLERIERLVAEPCPEPCWEEWLCLASIDAVLDCEAAGGPFVVDLHMPEDYAGCRRILLSSSALQTILLDLADVASAAGLFGIGPTVSGLRFEGHGEHHGTLRIDVRLIAGHEGGEPSRLARLTFLPSFVQVHRFEHHEGRWENVTPQEPYHIECEHSHISIRWGPADHHRLREGHYRVALVSPEATPIIDHHMRPLRPARFGRNFALAYDGPTLILADVRL